MRFEFSERREDLPDGDTAGSSARTAYFNGGGLSAGSGSWSVTVGSLSPGTTYYYRAAMQVGDRDFYGGIRSFTTMAASIEVLNDAWLELPATKSGANYVAGSFSSGGTRNYSYQYDKTMYSALWEAYPLSAAYTDGPLSSGSWSYNPDIDAKYQVDVRSYSYGTAYGDDTYSRGHLLPSADRKTDATMRSQIFYVTNQVPQIQNSFNDGVWGSLETATRGLLSTVDEVFVATGVVFRTPGGGETVKYLSARSGYSPAQLPVANYFWKVLLKVRRSGGVVVAASAIGFWFEHKAYASGSSYVSFARPVDEIEALTGLDMFVNLPDDVEAACEKNSSWETFRTWK